MAAPDDGTCRTRELGVWTGPEEDSPYEVKVGFDLRDCDEQWRPPLAHLFITPSAAPSDFFFPFESSWEEVERFFRRSLRERFTVAFMAHATHSFHIPLRFMVDLWGLDEAGRMGALPDFDEHKFRSQWGAELVADPGLLSLLKSAPPARKERGGGRGGRAGQSRGAAPRGPGARGGGRAPRTPDAPSAPRTPDAPRAPRAPDAPSAPRTPKTPKTPKAPKTPKTPRTPRAPRAPTALGAPRTPRGARLPGCAEA